VSYGVTVVVGEDLADAHLGPSTSLGVRFAMGALLLAIVLRVRGVALFEPQGVRVGLVLGLIYAVESTFFFSSLERMSAAATALVFYVYPAIVTIVELLRGRERAHRATFLALGLSTLGTGVVIAGGGRVDVTAAGVAFALAAAASFALYLLCGRQLGEGIDPMVVACWISAGASVSILTRGAIQSELVNPSSRTLELALYGLSTAAAFTLTFAAMRHVGAARVAVVMTLEAVASVVMAAVFLGEEIRPVQALGGVAVLAAAVVIARSQPSVATAAADAPDAGP
jgi:drug/metabolite transporter (DMT)-like permease